MQAIADGVELEDGEILVDAISYVTEDLTQIGIEIHSGKNRIVRRLLKIRLSRAKIRSCLFCRFNKENLSRGRWRYLTERSKHVADGCFRLITQTQLKHNINNILKYKSCFKV